MSRVLSPRRLLFAPVAALFLILFVGAPYASDAQWFTDAAKVGTSACSDDYSRVDDCYNRLAPKAPSLDRPIVTALDSSQDIATFPEGNADSAPLHVLPNSMTSADGRLVLAGGYDRPTLKVFRPENLSYDYQAAGVLSGQAEDQVYSGRQTFHWPTLLFGASTHFDLASGINLGHRAICDDSSNDYDLAGNLASGRNPRSCTALISQSDDPFDESAAATVVGDCYDLSILASATQDNLKRWELRTNKFTIFVPNAKQRNAGRSYIYPRIYAHELPFFGAFTASNAHKNGPGKWDYDWGYSYARDKTQSLCSGTSSQRPGWCSFLETQESRRNFVIDMDGDGMVDSGELWNGRHCGTNNPGQDCRHLFLFEPSITHDGRLLIMNAGGSGIYYSYSEQACSATGWRELRPISAMPYDSRLQQRYAIARNQVEWRAGQKIVHPFRDSQGRDIVRQSNGEFAEFRGAYPWIDRQGRNLFFSRVNDFRDGWLGTNITPPCPPELPSWKCMYDPPRTGWLESPDQGAGKGNVALGAWTNGKIVHLDNRLNMSSFGNVNNTPEQLAEFELDLYQGAPTYVRSLGSRQMQSYENLFNGYDALSPTMPFDVVWTMSSKNQQNVELVFDEYMDKKAFIVAHMNAPFTTFGGYKWVYPDDGFVPRNPNKSNRTHGMGEADFRFQRSPRLQNAATLSTRGSCPGQLEATASGCLVAQWSPASNRSHALLSPDPIVRVERWNFWAPGFLVRVFARNLCPDSSSLADYGLSGGTLWAECRLELPAGVSASQLFQNGSAVYVAGQANPLKLAPPSYLTLRGGARVEPVGLGGVLGNGVYLDGKNDFVEAHFPATSTSDVYLGLWLDNRASDDRVRTVFTFGDGSRIGLSRLRIEARHGGSDQLRWLSLDTKQLRTGEYFHLGFKITTDGSTRRIRTFLNGTLLRSELSFSTTAGPGFSFDDPWCTTGALYIGDPGDHGAPAPPFDGWIDELRVYALDPAAKPRATYFNELACNLALGTLVQVGERDGSSSSPELRELHGIAHRYGLLDTIAVQQGKRDDKAARPKPASAAVCEQLEIESHNHPSDLGFQHGRAICADRVHRNQHPQFGNRCLRKAVLKLVDRPLQAASPRPDFSGADFCLGCHTDQQRLEELSIPALHAGSVPRHQDPRRQPLDWPATLWGCTPTEPPFAATSECDSGGLLIDFLFDEQPKVVPRQ